MITITKGVAQTETQEGYQRRMPLEKFIAAINPPQLDLVLPNGVKMLVRRGNHLMLVYEMKPGAHRLKWVDKYEYKEFTLALPYVILLIPFQYWHGQIYPYGHLIECYYRNEPLTQPDDKLFYPALLNCGHWSASGVELPSWICMSRVNWNSIKEIEGDSQRLWKVVGLVRDHFLGAIFSLEWKGHWEDYQDWDQADPRIIDLKKWEQATLKDPSFITKVKWRPAEKNLQQTIDHTLGALGPEQKNLEKIILNQAS